MRAYLLPALAGFCLLLAATGVSAQDRSTTGSGATTLLIGYGGIDHEARLGPAYHVNLRQRLLRLDSLVVAPRVGERRVLPAMELQGELFGQLGHGGSGLVGCSFDPRQSCTLHVDQTFLLGGGVVGRVDLHRQRSWGVVYFLPLSVGAYLRGFEVEEWPIGTASSTESHDLRLSGGVGNGLGVELRLGSVTAAVELRAIITRDVQGGRGGSLPVGVGISW